MPQPEFSLQARRDLSNIYLFGVMTYGIAQADAYMAQLRSAIILHADNPHAAPERSEVRPPIRLFRSGAHHVFYDVIDGGVLVQRVLHHTADWTAGL